MKLKPLILLALALGCGLVAMLGVRQMMANRETQPQQEMVKVLVAVTDINPGVKLDETNVAFKDWPKDQVPAGAVTTAEEYDKRALKVSGFMGEVILQAKLGEKDNYGVSTSIPKGMRVVSVPVNNTSIHSGMVRPGDRVDVICTYKVNTKAGQISRTKTILEYMEVFAMDRSRQVDSSDSAKGAKVENLSLLCTPEQAAWIQLASSKGSLQMALRNRTDPPTENPIQISVDDLKFEGVETGQGALASGDEQLLGSPDAELIKEALVQKPVEEPEPAKEAEPVVEEAPAAWVIRIYEGGSVREETVGQPSVTSASQDKDKKTATPAIPTLPKPSKTPQKKKSLSNSV